MSPDPFAGPPVTTPPAVEAQMLFQTWVADYLHPTWWREDWLPMPLFEQLRTSAGARGNLSRFLHEQLGIDRRERVILEDPRWRIAVLAPHDLLRLVHGAGLVRQAEGIDRVVLGRERRLLREALGESDYVFARKSAPRLLRRLQGGNGTAAATAFDFSRLDQWDERCRKSGIACLAEFAGKLPEPWQQRLLLKLPKSYADDYAASLQPADTEREERMLRFWRRLARELRITWPN